MRVTPVSIANQALFLLGAGRIDAMSDGSTNAVVCNQFYDVTKDEVLSSYEWTCALYRTRLASVSGDHYSTWDYRYRLPVDPYCYRVVCLLDGEEYTDMPYEPWYKEGKYIYTNTSPCFIKYLGRVEDENDLDLNVVTCLVYALAAKIATKVVEDQKKAASMTQLYAMKRAEAISLDGMGRQSKRRPPTPWEDIG